MKKVCVLGGAGTIGHQFCKKLKADGYWVRAVDIKEPEFSRTSADEFYLQDLRNPQSVKEVLTVGGGFDMVFAFQARMGGALFIFSKDNDAEIIHDNLLMNLNVARIASETGVKKLLFSSSACMYGEDVQMDENGGSLKEEFAWHSGKPDSVYGVEKLASEEIYDSFRRNKGLDVRICRFHNIFSEEGVYKGGLEKAPAAVCRKVAEAVDGGEIEIFGDGAQTRSFLHIDEAYEGVMRLMASDYVHPINIGSSEQISINDLAKMVIGISGKNLTIKNVPSNALGVRGRNSDNTLIQEVLGWKPSKPLRDGMGRLYSWIDAQIRMGKPHYWMQQDGSGKIYEIK